MESKHKANRRNTIVNEVFECCVSTISRFLDFEEQAALKLVNRSAYYNLITADLWSQMKLQIVADKYNYMDDNLDFEDAETREAQQQPETETKMLRNIRIHSLNKRVQQSPLKNPHPNPTQQRFPSTFKNRLPPKQSNLKFMKTEMGFKRPGLGSKAAVSYDYLLELPDNLELALLSFNSHGKESMQKMLEREALIGQMVGRWLEFQKKILETICVDVIKQAEQTAFWRAKETLVSEYNKRFTNVKYKTILNNISNSLILDDSLKKKMAVFLHNDSSVSSFFARISDIRSLYQKIEDRISTLPQLEKFKHWQEIEDVLDTYFKKYEESKEFLSKAALNFIESIDQLIEDGLNTLDLSIKKICTLSEEVELILEILSSIFNKIIRQLIVSECKFKQSLLTSKYEKYKGICASLLKMGKYFSKVKVQLRNRQKKSGGDVKEIEGFIHHYSTSDTEYILFDEKSVDRVNREMEEFKRRIDLMKSSVKRDKE